MHLKESFLGDQAVMLMEYLLRIKANWSLLFENPLLRFARQNGW